MSRKPRIALMGEFSAGKSTLSNLLLGERCSPVKVTATQLPPVWFVKGTDDPYRLDIDGSTEPVDVDNMEGISVDETSYVRVFLETDILDLCEIIDMPGISDPNMAPEVWQRTLHHADAIIWCSHATQAWRQSEAAVWQGLPEEMHAKSFLLLTRFDKLMKEGDKRRVLNRVRKETHGLFRAVYPISLIEALAAEEDRELWETSGAEEFTQALLDLILELDMDARATDGVPKAATERPEMIDAATPPMPEDVIPLAETEAAPVEPVAPVAPGETGVGPRRVARSGGSSTPRPGRPSSDGATGSLLS